MQLTFPTLYFLIISKLVPIGRGKEGEGGREVREGSILPVRTLEKGTVVPATQRQNKHDKPYTYKYIGKLNI